MEILSLEVMSFGQFILLSFAFILFLFYFGFVDGGMVAETISLVLIVGIVFAPLIALQVRFQLSVDNFWRAEICWLAFIFCFRKDLKRGVKSLVTGKLFRERI